MSAELGLFLLVLIAGCGAFLFCTLYLLFQLVGGIGRGIGRMLGIGRAPYSKFRTVDGRVHFPKCPKVGCGHVEYRDARFCSRCGTRMVVQVRRGAVRT